MDLKKHEYLFEERDSRDRLSNRFSNRFSNSVSRSRLSLSNKSEKVKHRNSHSSSRIESPLNK